jgi:hypothetical protein
MWEILWQCRWPKVKLNESHAIVERAVKLLISEVPQGGPADKHTVCFEDLSHQC